MATKSLPSKRTHVACTPFQRKGKVRNTKVKLDPDLTIIHSMMDTLVAISTSISSHPHRFRPGALSSGLSSKSIELGKYRRIFIYISRYKIQLQYTLKIKLLEPRSIGLQTGSRTGGTLQTAVTTLSTHSMRQLSPQVMIYIASLRL
jgi:hypothetical protein